MCWSKINRNGISVAGRPPKINILCCASRSNKPPALAEIPNKTPAEP